MNMKRSLQFRREWHYPTPFLLSLEKDTSEPENLNVLRVLFKLIHGVGPKNRDHRGCFGLAHYCGLA